MSLPSDPWGDMGTIVAARQPLSEVFEQALLVEALGYDSVWIPEIAGRDAIATTALVAARTDTLRVGTGIVPLGLRSPVLLAMGAATVAEASGGRFMLGVGIGHRETIGPWFAAGSPQGLRETEDDLEILSRLLTDGAVEHAGHRGMIDTRLRGVHHDAAPPILLAALSPGLARLAGRCADGLLLNWVTPERVAELVAVFREEAQRSGRDPDKLVVGAYVPVSVTDDLDGARRALAKQLAAYGRLTAYHRSLTRCGLGPDIERVLAASQGQAADAVSDRLLKGVAAIGDRQAVLRRLKVFRSAGVTLPIIAPLTLPDGNGWASMVETWTALAPNMQ